MKTSLRSDTITFNKNGKVCNRITNRLLTLPLSLPNIMNNISVEKLMKINELATLSTSQTNINDSLKINQNEALSSPDKMIKSSIGTAIAQIFNQRNKSINSTQILNGSLTGNHIS